MHPIIERTFCGLSSQYYVRQFFFGLIFPVLFVVALHGGAGHSAHSVSFSHYFYLAINTLLYPYSRLAYERLVGFVVGDNIFIVNATVMLVVKSMTMALCWGMAIFIAPIGLFIIYVYSRKAVPN